MIKNYLRVALRGLRKNKSYVIINTLGLGVSLACCITAYLLLAYNIEFDNFHDSKKVSHIFSVHTLSKDRTGKDLRDAAAPIVLPPIAVEEIAGLERYTRFIFGGGAMRHGDDAFNENFAFADSTFFDMFDFPLIAGSHKAFKDKKSIVLSEKLARKYFGDADPIGKLMVLDFINNTQIEVLVGAVVRKFPVNNSFTFDAMLRVENYIDIYKPKMDDWSDWRNPSTFFQISSPKNAANIASQFTKYIPNRNRLRTDIVVDRYELVPFKANFNQDDVRSSWVNQRISAVPLIIFTSLAGMILLIACFNLTNTTIAMTGKRLKEVGVRKSVGAARFQIISQFLLETVITILLSLGVGLLMAQIIVPAFYSMWQLPYGMGDLNGVNLFIALITLVFLAAMLAGIYPALFSSKFKPVLLLKGGVKISGTNFLTRTLVTSQFALSVIVLIAGVVFIQNARFQEGIKFGYDKEMVVSVSIKSESDFKAMEAGISQNPKILSIGWSDGNIGSNNYQTPIKIDTSRYEVQAMGVGKNYFETMGLRISEGRTLNLDNESDRSEGVIVNKAFLARTGLKDPIDKVITLHDKQHRILGVSENHVDNLYRSKEFEPFVFYAAGQNQYVSLMVKAERANLPEVQKYLETTWKSIFPTKPFESRFQEDMVMKGTKDTNANLEKIFLFITVLGGLLSASGIFALASLNIARRTKEIGIRKVLGATELTIVGLLNREFILILLIAAILGSVGGYFLTDLILGKIYAYHVAVGMISVVLCAVLIFAVGIATTSSTILSAAKANPVDTLRSE
jgi:putative ABC transport system permease protein